MTITNTTNPQAQYHDNQDTFDVDIDDLFSKYIAPIDAQRSHFNALTANPQAASTAAYQESRCHAFLRMIGFPVVAPSGAFYSPGFDPNLNTDIMGQKTNTQTASALIANSDFIKSQTAREGLPLTYSSMFSFGGVNASAVSVASIFPRSFANQFTPDLPPLSYDTAQVQTIQQRSDLIVRSFGASTAAFTAQIPDVSSIQTLLQSTHIIKPFIVDPRIDNSVQPAANKICAPFLLDKTQTSIFGSQNNVPVSLKRPYIERVISTRFNSTNVTETNTQPYVNSIINQIKNGSDVLDEDLINTISNPNYALHQSEYQIFNDFIKFIRALVETLHNSIVDVQDVMNQINFQPLPNSTSGIEAGSNGGSIVDAIPGDPNNRETENNIVKLMYAKYLDEASYDTGTGSQPDPGNRVFNNTNDTATNTQKDVKKSWDQQLSKLNKTRNKAGADALDDLKKIEIITGEFGGIGLLDIFAIQAALWIMDPSALLGLIDTRAFNRISNRTDVTLGGASQMAPLAALSSFEQTVQQIYQLIDAFIQTLIKNDYFTDTNPTTTTNTSVTSP